MSVEIERKWIPSKEFIESLMPSIEGKANDIEQGYLTDDFSRVIRVRIIKTPSGKTYGKLTLKLAPVRTLGVQEFEYDVPVADAEIIMKSAFCKLHKLRAVKDEWEFDMFLDRHDGIILIEREFSSEEEALAFVAPEGFLEVTGDPRFTNNYLAKAILENIYDVITVVEKHIFKDIE